MNYMCRDDEVPQEKKSLEIFCLWCIKSQVLITSLIVLLFSFRVNSMEVI